MTEERKSQDVEIRIHSVQQVDGEIAEQTIQELGRLVTVNGSHYLRFEDADVENDIRWVSTIKLDRDNRVTVTRKASNTGTTRLRFDPMHQTAARYQTPYGDLRLLIDTRKVAIVYKTQPFSGQVQLIYNLYHVDQPMGNFKVNIDFTV